MSGRRVAPVDDGQILVDPPMERVGELLHINRRRFERAEVLISGTDLRIWRSFGKRLLHFLSQRVASRSGEPVVAIDPDRPVIMAGHQPELFHPGVWIKNFALNALARKHRLSPINLIVDNDTLKSTSLHMPDLGNGRPESIRSVVVAFDAWHGELPYEDLRVSDPAMFASFADRVQTVTHRWPFRTILPDLWTKVLSRVDDHCPIGDGFAAARRATERQWGCHNVEIALHSICSGMMFQAFVTHVLADLPRFHSVHNTCLQSYRRTNDVHSRNHPVPDLAADGGWLESPFWIWRTGETRRARLFARPQADGQAIELRTDRGSLPSMVRQHSYGDRMKYSLGNVQREGYRIRSRALTTTIFARLFLADLFIHGIGGGKYDELTDLIIKHYFHIEPPEYMVISGTLRLPIPGFPATEDRRRNLERSIRDFRWNPQRHPWSSPSPERDLLVAERERLNQEAPIGAAGKDERFRKIRDVTRQMRQQMGEDAQESQLHADLSRCNQELAANQILRRRDYSFCLFPEQQLREFCTQLL